MTSTSANSIPDSVQAAYPDAYGIGQRSIARINIDVARKGLAEADSYLLSTSYQPEQTLPMWVRIYRADRADYDRALAVLGGAQ